MLGCLLIAFLGNNHIALYGKPPGDSSGCAGFSHAADSGPITFTDDDNLLSNEAFLSPEQKYDLFLMLLSLRERCDSHAQAWMLQSVAWSQTTDHDLLYQEPSITSFARILHSTQLLC